MRQEERGLFSPFDLWGHGRGRVTPDHTMTTLQGRARTKTQDYLGWLHHVTDPQILPFPQTQ